MLNPFPELLILSFFAPTLLRLAAGITFLYVAYQQIRQSERIAQLVFPLVGKGAWIAWFSILFHAGVGVLFIAGYYTQIAALLGAVGAFKGLLLAKRYPALIPLSRGTSALLVIISLSLLISGAGALAFDLPL